MSANPPTNAPSYLQLNPSLQFITLGTANLPSTMTVASVQNRAGLQDAVIQATASKQPGWSANALAGPFLYVDRPGANSFPITSAAGTSSLVGVPGFNFTGTQFFEYDTLASAFAGTGVGITVVCVLKSTTTAGTQTIWGLGTAGASPSLQLQLNGSALKLVDSTGNTTASVAGIGTGLCVCSATRVGTTVAIRVWTNVGSDPVGLPTLQTATATIATPAATTYTTFCIGAVNVSAAQTNFFNGAIGKFGVYGVQAGTTVADIEEVEAEFLLSVGLSRVQDLATATAAGGLEA